MGKANFLALDLGAESGRGLLGCLDGGKIKCEVIHRFATGPVHVFDHMHWDVLRFLSEMKNAVSIAAARVDRITGMGIDTWGVDYGLLGAGGGLLGNPYHYRDSRTDGMMEAVFDLVPRHEVFAHTGIQFLPFNTIYQLYATKLNTPYLLDAARSLLMMGELLTFLFTGEKVGEFTNCTTSQLYDPRQERWSEFLFSRLGLPIDIMPEVVKPGTLIGDIHPLVAEETGVERVPVIAPAVHDTGSAVAAVPAEGKNWAFISSGTWSLMGVEVDQPIINDQVLAHNFTNEGGVEDTFRFLKNIAGLWLVQECRRTWEKEGNSLDYDQLTRLAAGAEPFHSIIEPDDPVFAEPGDMPARIRKHCRDNGEPEPEDRGQVIRCILESLALKYRYVCEKLGQLTGRQIDVIHIVGGGTQNRLLNQFTADATGKTVITGPVEATALGNMIMQAIGTGHLGSVAEGRRVVACSFDLETYEPRDTDRWTDVYEERFKRILS